MIDELATPAAVDADELADEDRIADEAVEPGVDANGRPESPILTALRRLGPATAREIANEIHRDINNVSTRLRQMEQQGRTRRTGRTVNPDSARGGPQVEWDITHDGDAPTDATTALASTGPVEDRIRRMAERVGQANGRIEQVENELEAARARADREEQRARDAERRRQEAERRANAAGERSPEFEAAQRRVQEAEEQHARDLAAARARIETLEAEAAAAPTKSEGGGIRRDGMRDRYFDLLLGQAAADGAGEHVYDRIERLIDGGGDEA